MRELDAERRFDPRARRATPSTKSRDVTGVAFGNHLTILASVIEHVLPSSPAGRRLMFSGPKAVALLAAFVFAQRAT